MHLQTVIPCVQYDDFLSETLPVNGTLLDNVTVLTAPSDRATIELATRCGASVFPTEAWYVGGRFNKARALNEWVAHARNWRPDSWLLTLDADTLLLEPVSPHLAALDPAGLYGVPRRLCESLTEYGDLLTGRAALQQLPRDIVPVIDGKLWGFAPTANPAGVAGYFQLWRPATSAGAPHFWESGSAEHYDYQFALSFPEELRAYVNMADAIHLGPHAVNWNGRVSPRWQILRAPASAREGR